MMLKFCITKVRLITVTKTVIVASVTLLIYQMLISYKINSNDHILNSNSEIKTTNNLDKFFNTSITNSSLSNQAQKPKIKGTLPNDVKYIVNERGHFECSLDSIEINVSHLNDDYCDCPVDGMDEPGTSACQNGRFYCNYQRDYSLCKYSEYIFMNITCS